jgi:hypothetical protein
MQRGAGRGQGPEVHDHEMMGHMVPDDLDSLSEVTSSDSSAVLEMG